MLRDMVYLTSIFCLSIGSLFLIVAMGKPLGVMPEDLHGPTFVFSLTSEVLAIMALIAPIIIILASHFFLKNGLWQDLGFTKHFVWSSALGLCFGILTQLASYILKYWSSGGATLSISIPSGTSLTIWAAYFSWFLFCLVLNSLSEELLYRVLPLFLIVKNGINPILTSILISLVFSLIHFLTSEVSFPNFLFRFLY